jgi:predicted dehydrogenase
MNAHGSLGRPMLMVGFNRRFAPHTQKIKSLLQSVCEPKSVVVTVNAGAIAADHWTQDPEIGGGRIIGEACHFVDLVRYLVGSPIVSKQCRAVVGGGDIRILEDNAAVILGFADGSIGTINYLSNGAANYQKERIEIFSAGRILRLDNFRRLTGFGWPTFRKMNLWRQDKGHKNCARAFLAAAGDGTESPIPFEELVEVASVTIEMAKELRRQ